jgi:hypothetical protein
MCWYTSATVGTRNDIIWSVSVYSYCRYPLLARRRFTGGLCYSLRKMGGRDAVLQNE